MKELNTIQKREKLNKVFATDEIGPGGANHKYLIVSDVGLQVPKEQKIVFQKGARKEENSQHGVIDTDLLEIVRDRLKSFQAGPFSSRENACALTHIEEALMWMNRRVEDRIERNVLGRNEK
ncbi:Acb2/Tad1 domain-containing protein [Clostridium weizhouense]|uniref:ABC transporter ATPase n=1 Tax=Clostridium weizhouense TaxID=2859781 RepID=A0ABS7AK03_9CLOT|nr:ABC transporter ATPase [Clostridium weizhouense]MBW6408978.1 ABC transporter ATPase [Clostridium weizhouense]